MSWVSRRLLKDLATFFALFLGALALPAVVAPGAPLVGMVALTLGLCVAGLYGRRIRRRAGF